MEAEVLERTLTIIKPDAISASKAGAILAHLEKEGFRLAGVKRLRLSPEQARAFYEVHRERSFYEGLVRFMTEGPVVVAALERGNAVIRLAGRWGPTRRRPRPIRNLHGTDIERNAIHGSDSPDNAAKEIAFSLGGRAELVSEQNHQILLPAE
jgi:nucleoside-diphosphate kinase